MRVTYVAALSSSTTGCPIEGTKSNSTQFFLSRYKEAFPPIMLKETPWKPQCAAIDAMFLLNTTPLGCHNTFQDYSHFLILLRFIVSQFSKGHKEVHIQDSPTMNT